MTPDDTRLMHEYVSRQSEDAFATLVARYTNLVYSAALRQLGSPELAEEVTQAVFVILARKAAGLSPKTILSGWLYRTARFVAIAARKQESRRQNREQEAYMQSELDQQPGASWEQLAPLLDDAMARLGDRERDALILRYFEDRSLSEVSIALGASEDAAKKRVSRALDKLRGYFARRGVAVPASSIAGLVAAHSVQTAPAALAKSAAAAAISQGTTSSVSTLTLIKGAMKVMAWTKAKTAIVVSVAVIAAASTTGVMIQSHHHHDYSNPLPENSWANAGYATPEAALETTFWAMRNADIKTLQASYTTDFGDQFMQTAGKGKSQAELAALFKQIVGKLGTFQIDHEEQTKPDQVILHFNCGVGSAVVPVKKIGAEWKLNGNINTEKQTQAGDIRQ